MRVLVVFSLLSVMTASRAFADKKPDSITVVVVGDVGLNRSGVSVNAGGLLEGSSVLSWDELTSGIAPLIDGDLNFMNLETVVTKRNDLAAGNKRQKSPYLFRSHPAGVKKLIELGFNLISGANNHAYDYGEEGAKETVRYLQDLTEGRKDTVYAGIGLNVDEAARPATLMVRGAKVAFSSIGIVTNMITAHRAGPSKAGTLGFRFAEDWQRSLSELVAITADLKLMSVHYGVERDIRTDERQRSAWRQAIDDGADMVIGHHAHVVRGVELHKGKVIFYGLGNFLIRGAANMGNKPELRICCDFGLLAKVHLTKSGEGYAVAAIEAVPMTDMHRIARRLPADEAGKRVQVLNVLAESLDDPASKSEGVQFAIQSDGSGLYCNRVLAAKGPAKVKKLCATYTGPSAASDQIRQRVRAAPNPSSPKFKRGRRGTSKGAHKKGKHRRRK